MAAHCFNIANPLPPLPARFRNDALLPPLRNPAFRWRPALRLAAPQVALRNTALRAGYVCIRQHYNNWYTLCNCVHVWLMPFNVNFKKR